MVQSMPLSYPKMEISDLSAVFAVRLASVENVVTMEDLEEDYGITPE